MQLVQAGWQAWAGTNGITLGGSAGQGQSLSPEANATRQAEQWHTSGALRVARRPPSDLP